MWIRKEGQTIESAIMENESCEIALRSEPLGESLAMKHDDAGFYTTSDGGTPRQPIYYYPFL